MTIAINGFVIITRCCKFFFGHLFTFFLKKTYCMIMPRPHLLCAGMKKKQNKTHTHQTIIFYIRVRVVLNKLVVRVGQTPDIPARKQSNSISSSTTRLLVALVQSDHHLKSLSEPVEDVDISSTPRLVDWSCLY